MPAAADPVKKELFVTLVRHGQAGHVELPGFVQAPLTPLGQRQAKRVAKRFKTARFDHIYSSDLSRALQTAQAIAAHHPDTPFTIDGDIREVGTHHCRRGQTPRKPTTRQTIKLERQRVERFWAMLQKKHKPGQHILVVAHGSLIGLLVAIATGLDPRHTPPLDTRNTCVTTLATQAGGYELWGSPARLVLALCTRHLPASLIT